MRRRDFTRLFSTLVPPHADRMQQQMESTEESQQAIYAKRGLKTANKGRKAYSRGSRLHMLWKVLLALLVIGLALGLGLGLGLKKGGGDDDDDDDDGNQ